MLSEIVMAYQAEAVHIVTQLLLQQHMAFHDSTAIRKFVLDFVYVSVSVYTHT